MDTILTPRKTGFNSKDCHKLKIGNWTAYYQSDGNVLWMKPKSLFSKKMSDVVVYATPHYNQRNEVAVDVIKGDRSGDAVLSKTFRIQGEWVASDLKTYMVEMKAIFEILK